MFIKTSIRKQSNGKEYRTHYIVEGFRDPKSKKVKHKYVANLTNLPAHIVLSIQKLLKNNKGELTKLDLADMQILCNKEYGNIKLFKALYEKYFAKYFKNTGYNKAIQAIVLNKIFNPKSKNGLKNWLSKVDMGYEITNKNDLYECLDYLEEEQPKIEQDLSTALVKNRDCNILLYDITSTYFEGKGAENICKYGYSRDHRRDRVQVNIGVITTADGTPISVEILAGNISDKTTLQDQIKKLQEKFDLKEITFVFDRGMKSKVNLKKLEEVGYSYITALSHAELKKKCDNYQEVQYGLFDKQDLAEFEIDNKYYSLVHNVTKATKDRETRRSLINKTTEKLEAIKNLKRNHSLRSLQDKISKVINKYNCSKFISYTIEEFKDGSGVVYGKLEYGISEDKIKEVEQYDGFYMIESTNKSIQGDKAVSQYKDLQLVERAFDVVKNHIEIRPVFHYKESRIKGHIMSSFMSYFLVHKFKQKCKELLKEYTLDDLLTELSNIHKTYFKINNFCFEKITQVSNLADKILKLFHVKLLSPA